MKICLPAVCLVAAILAGGPAYALDCKKASTALEHKICADNGLLKADASMSAAYLNLLHIATDPDIRAALINSQRRWITARESNLGSLGKGDDAPDAADQRKIVLDATVARMQYLTARTNEKPQFITEALKQRALVSAYSGGPFGGYSGSCYFIADRQNAHVYNYSCFGALSVQNGDRVCTDNQDFASYSSDEQRAVANIVDGKPNVIATCTINSGSDSECPDMEGAGKEARWNLKPTSEQADIGDGSARLTKLDPELSAANYDQTWLKPCLTDQSFPTSNPAGNRSDGK